MKKFSMALIMLIYMTASVFSGIEWTTTITTQGKKKRENSEVTSVVAAQNGDFRQSFENVPKRGNQNYIKDGYWLYKGNERMLYIVNDKEKTVTPMSLDALLQMSRMMGPLVKIKIQDMNVKSKQLPSATLLGYRCNHIHMVTDYTMKMKVTLIKKTIKVHEEKEIWASPAVKGLPSLSSEFLKRDFKTGFEDLDKMIEKQVTMLKKLGFPLKTVTRTVNMNKKGKVTQELVQTSEVTAIRHKTFPKSYFEIPADYQMAQTRGMEEEDAPNQGNKKKKKKFGLF